MPWMKKLCSLVWERTSGEPIRLRELLATASGKLDVDLAPKGIAEGQVTDWGNWRGDGYGVSPSGAKAVLTGWKMKNGHYLGDQVSFAALGQLVRRETDPRFTCDIRDIEGLCSSKSDLALPPTLDDFAEVACKKLIAEVSPKALNELLQWGEIRIMHGGDNLALYGWDGRVFYSNNGGSHHFAAARYVAGELGREVPITGRLERDILCEDAVAQLTAEFEVFVLPEASALPENFEYRLIESMEAIEASYYKRSLPRPHSGCTALFLPRSDGQSMKAAAELRNAGAMDLGAHFRHLVQRQHELREASEYRVMQQAAMRPGA